MRWKCFAESFLFLPQNLCLFFLVDTYGNARQHPNSSHQRYFRAKQKADKGAILIDFCPNLFTHNFLQSFDICNCPTYFCQKCNHFGSFGSAICLIADYLKEHLIRCDIYVIVNQEYFKCVLGTLRRISCYLYVPFLGILAPPLTTL